MLPEQINPIDERRAAIAPYNFVPLPPKIVPAEVVDELERLTKPKGAQTPPEAYERAVRQERYHAQRHTGTIACTLTAETPLYVRCGYTPEQYAALALTPFEDLTDDQRKLRAQFFSLDDPNAPVIPGSSLRGMLRALVEIAAYGKMEKVTNRPRYFFRAVAAKTDDPLARPYRDLLRNVRAGYMLREGGAWFIQPARSIGAEGYLKAREQDIPPALGLVRLNDPNYYLQTIAISYTTKKLKPSPRNPQGRVVVDLIGPPGAYPEPGTIVTSGNMLETGGGWQRSPRKNHAVIGPATTAKLPIAPEAVDDYRNSLSAFQADELGDDGVLQPGRPVFYCEPGRGEPVRFFGHSPNFRVPFVRPGAKRAATPADFVPAEHRDPTTIDLAEAIFGFVRPERQQQSLQALAGRVFVGDARLDPGQPDALFAEPLTPQILATPKPTTFQHYLVQTQAERTQTGTDNRGRPIYQLPLAHYATPTPEQTVVRGHKLYWHQGAHPSIGLPANQLDTNESQKTLIRPVKAGATFSFTLRFENLSDVELGALLWVLRLAADPRYRLKLGMGRPLGMGAVKIANTVTLSDRKQRYRTLFGEQGWSISDETTMNVEHQADMIRTFEGYVLRESQDTSGNGTLESTLRIQCLLALLGWPGPEHAQTRYMEIERDRSDYIPAARLVNPRDPSVNEYKDRPVLPRALQVAGIDASARTPQAATAAPSTAPQLPAVGKTFTGLVFKRDEAAVVIEVPGFRRERAVAVLTIEPSTPQWKPGERARVEVTGVRQRGDLTILDVKRGAKAEKK